MRDLPLKIVADENIPLVRELFARHGDLTLRPGRAITAADVRDADALLIRSVTRVDSALVEQSRLRFIGSATIGTDHVDRAALQNRSIRFANAPGCNANAVAEYVLAGLLVLAERGKFQPGHDVIGILGYGNVGRRLAAKLAALNWPFRVCDTPLQQLQQQQLQQPPEPIPTPQNGWCTPAALRDCAVLTLHVPLDKSGPHATWHWLDVDTLASTEARVIINSCRGAVVDNEALLRWLHADACHAAILDVWEQEPDVAPDLLARVDLATPHIAGHSREGKLNGSFMIHDAFCQTFALDAGGAAQWQLPIAGQASLADDNAQQLLLRQLLKCYDPRHDDARMRGALAAATDRRAAFDGLRKQYPERRELASWRFAASGAIARRYRALAGFDGP